MVHQVYDSDHMLHCLLKRALSIVKDTALDPMIVGRVQDVEWAFEHVEDRAWTAASIARIHLGRKTQSYARAVQLATMIVLDHAPDIKGGQTKLLGLMFDMNVLYERVVLKLLQQAVRNHPVVTITGTRNSTVFGSSNDPTGHHYQTAVFTRNRIRTAGYPAADTGKPSG